MKKRCLMVLSALVCLLSFAACGTTTTEETYGNYTSAQIESAMMSQVESLEDLSTDELATYYSYYESAAESDDSLALYAEIYGSWAEVRPEAGDFVAYEDFDIDKSGKTVTATLTVDYSLRDIELVYVFNGTSMELTSVNAQLVYGLGETMAKAGLNTLMGILIVFVVLVILSLLIYCFRYISVLEEKTTKEEKQQAKPATPTVNTVQEEMDDTELVAVIAAAIAASTGTTTDDFVVRSIKRRY